MAQVVLVHEEMGVYIGEGLGMAFWSRLEDLGLESAVCFVSAEDAADYMASVAHPECFDDVRQVEVEPDQETRGCPYISFEALKAQGLGDYLKPNTLH